MERWLLLLILPLGLFGCGAGDETLSDEQPVANTADVYWLANQCLQLQTEAGSISRQGDHYYVTSMAEQAEPFHFEPSALGEYMLFDSAGSWLSADANANAVQAIDAARLDDHVRWQVISQGQGQGQVHIRAYTKASQPQAWLSVHGGQLTLSASESAAESFSFAPATGCTEFPDTTTNTQGAPGRSHFDDGALWGMADIHNHLFGGMAFAGNVMAGEVFHPLGITKALQDCRAEHGLHGWMDVTGFITGGPGDEFEQISRMPFYYLTGRPFHSTEGYPDFPYWPNAKTKTHTMGYYKWVERAYLGGLRLMVNLMVESPPLCQVGRSINRWYGPNDELYIYNPDVVCNGEVTALKQRQATFDLQDYVDAQAGGPGKGWFRIVNTPEQARAVIAEKKMAVILGVELPDLFDCIDSGETAHAECTPGYIERRLDEYEQLGFRSIFPVHHYDNDFGGAKVFNPIIELGGVVQTGSLFKYEACEQDGYDPLLALKLPQLYFDLFPQAFKDLPLFPFIPQAAQYCNAESITPLGEHLILELMKRGMIIETNHMSPNMKQVVLEMAEREDYPLIDSHQGKAWSDAEREFEARYLALGGARSPMPNMVSSEREYAGMVKTCDPATSQDFAIHLSAIADLRNELGIDPGVVMSTDIHGMVSESQPRFGEQAECDQVQMMPVEYPFTSVDGAVTFERQQTGNRVFDFNTDGMAHYGLLPDLVEDMRRQGLAESKVQQLFRGAEAYLVAWEKARRYRERRGASELAD